MSQDNVNKPSHYTRIAQKLGVECIEVIEALDHLRTDFRLGNAFKYLWRTGAKDAMPQEVNKAAWYLLRWLLENNPSRLHETLRYFGQELKKSSPVDFDGVDDSVKVNDEVITRENPFSDRGRIYQSNAPGNCLKVISLTDEPKLGFVCMGDLAETNPRALTLWRGQVEILHRDLGQWLASVKDTDQ